MAIRTFLPLGALALATLVAGCGGPELVVRNINGQPGKAYFRGTRDAQQNEISRGTPEQPIGDLPTEWEIPRPLLGGHGLVHVVFADGTEATVYDFKIRATADTVLEVAKPPVIH